MQVSAQNIVTLFALCCIVAAAIDVKLPTSFTTPDMMQSSLQKNQVLLSSSEECDYCQLTEGEISMLLQNQQAKNIVKQQLGTVCDDLPFNSVECMNLLDLYIDQVFHILLQYLQNDSFCVETELCPKTDKFLNKEAHTIQKPVEKVTDFAPPSAECEFCQLAEGEIAMLVENQQAKNIVKQSLGVVCTDLPYSSVKCENLLDLYVDQVFHMFQQYLQQDEFCSEFGYCAKSEDFSSTKNSDQFLGDLPSSAECEYCQLAEGEVAMLLQNQQAKNIVKQSLGVVCDDLPFNSVECVNLLGLYVDQVFHILLQYLQNDYACVALELCPEPASSQQLLNIENGLKVMDLPSSDECDYCQLAEGEIAMLLQNQQAKNIVKEDLDVVCNDLPFNSVECTNLLGLYVDQVFHMFLSYLQEDQFCVEFELCPKADFATEIVLHE